MKILNIRCYNGRNIYSHRPAARAEIDLGALWDTPTKDIAGFNSKLLSLFPGLRKHCCSCGYEGGFADRLAEGTYLAHVTEHLVQELQSLAGYDVHFGRSRVLKPPSVYYIVFEYIDEKCAAECLHSAVKIVNSLIAGETPDTSGILDSIRKTAAGAGLGPSARAIYDEAVRRGVPVTRLDNSSILQLGYGRYSRRIGASLTDRPSCISVDIAGNKHLTKQILAAHNIPVPYGDIAWTSQSAAAIAELIGYPVVVKPFDANQGKGITLGITHESEIEYAFREVLKFSDAAIVENYIEGRDYRLLVVGGRLSAAAERIPPSIVGDGLHTVRELVEIENRNPLRGDDHEKPLTRIKMGNLEKQVLSKYGLDEGSVPAAGEKIYLRHNGNLSTGGVATDCTSEVHPCNAALAVKAAGLLGLDIAGIDITAKDIRKPIAGGNGAIIEINAAPGLRMHLYPTCGKAVNVASDIIDMLAGDGGVSSIPIVAVTGTNGKTTTTRLIGHVFELAGKTAGMTTTSGIRIGNEYVLKGDNTGPVSARIVLSDKRVEAAVLETARGGIVRKGLGYDLADVGVIVNISEDHLGIDGVDTIEDLAMVKSLVIEAVKPDGYAVLNADDGTTPFFLGRVRSKVVLFARDIGNPLLQTHLKKGGRAVYTKDGAIFAAEGKRATCIADLKDIPITFKGMAACNIENSLAAVSALTALDISLPVIKLGLMSFKPDASTNPGRFNIFEVGDFRVMLDYGHNPAGCAAVINCISGMEHGRAVGVIGMPGDRNDKCIRDVGMMCGKAFSKLYIKEDADLRGRNPGEVAEILFDAAVHSGMKPEDINIVHSEVRALQAAMADAQPGDLIVMFYEEFEAALEAVQKYKKMLGQEILKKEEIAVG